MTASFDYIVHVLFVLVWWVYPNSDVHSSWSLRVSRMSHFCFPECYDNRGTPANRQKVGEDPTGGSYWVPTLFLRKSFLSEICSNHREAKFCRNSGTILMLFRKLLPSPNQVVQLGPMAVHLCRLITSAVIGVSVRLSGHFLPLNPHAAIQLLCEDWEDVFWAVTTWVTYFLASKNIYSSPIAARRQRLWRLSNLYGQSYKRT